MKTGFEFASSKIVDDVMCQSCRLRNPVVSNTIKYLRLLICHIINIMLSCVLIILTYPL
ncbi:hypothetical protein D3C87_1008800 [compost metagenome]